MNSVNVYNTPIIPIQGKFCTLEPLDADAHGQELFLRFCIDANIFPNNLYGPFDNYPDFKKWLIAEEIPSVSFVVIHNSKPSGLISIHNADEYNAITEIGATFSKDLQNTSAATEAIYLVLDKLFLEYHYRCVQWHCICKNINSINAAKRLYFKHDLVCRHFYIYKNEQLDGLYFSITDDEWNNIRYKYIDWLYSPTSFDEDGRQLIKLNPDYHQISQYNSLSYRILENWKNVIKIDINDLEIANYKIIPLTENVNWNQFFEFIGNHPEIFLYKNYGEFATVDDLRAWFAKFNKNWEHYLVIDKISLKITSVISLVTVSEDSGIFELNLLMATHAFVTQALSPLIAHLEKVAFGELGYQRMQMLSNVEDNFMHKILQANHFINEGVLRKCVIIKHKSYDMTMWVKIPK